MRAYDPETLDVADRVLRKTALGERDLARLRIAALAGTGLTNGRDT